jgi:RNA polymerase sigma-70 factor (ECF subfamily)
MAQAKLPIPPPFETLIDRFGHEMMRYLMRVTGDRDDAADLFQETFLRAYRAYPRFDPDSDARPWLYTIATNLCRNRARDGARRAAVFAVERRAPDDAAASPARVVVAHTTGADWAGTMLHVRRLIARLPQKQRQALLMRYFAGLDYAEIAAALECSEQSARANVSQAIKKLKGAW